MPLNIFLKIGWQRRRLLKKKNSYVLLKGNLNQRCSQEIKIQKFYRLRGGNLDRGIR